MRFTVQILLLMLFVVGGCRQQGQARINEYETIAQDARWDTTLAKQHSARAVRLLAENRLEDAERELKAALKADIFFGPAHNNLGTVYYQQKKYYRAAWEFQYAAKLMSHRGEPKNNLGMVFEAVGKLEKAAKSYEDALHLQPESVETIGNLARVLVRLNRDEKRMRELLREIIMKDERPEWRDWANERLASMGKLRTSTTQPSSSAQRE